MSKYTPGPWTRDERDARVWSAQGKLVALALGAGVFSEEEILGNGYLLAAAPELLQACKEVLGHFAGTVDDHVALPIGFARYQKLQKAIAKAEGQ